MLSRPPPTIDFYDYHPYYYKCTFAPLNPITILDCFTLTTDIDNVICDTLSLLKPKVLHILPSCSLLLNVSCSRTLVVLAIPPRPPPESTPPLCGSP